MLLFIFGDLCLGPPCVFARVHSRVLWVVGKEGRARKLFFDGPFLAEARAGREEEHLRVLDREGKRRPSDTLLLLL